MKKIENILESCKDCGYCQRFNPQRHGIGSAFVCELTQRLITVAPSPYQFEFPNWCPLETYKEAEPAREESTQSGTVILPGLPHLEWMTENLKGYGGTEVDGRWYYTWEEAMAAEKQIGDGWRLPTQDELVALCDLSSTWDDKGPDGMPGRLFGNDLYIYNNLFLPASGYRYRASGALACVGSYGFYWSSSPNSSGSANAGALGFSATNVSPLNGFERAYGFTVRCVREIHE